MSELNATSLPYPGTALKLVYSLVGGTAGSNSTHIIFRPDQEF